MSKPVQYITYFNPNFNKLETLEARNAEDLQYMLYLIEDLKSMGIAYTVSTTKPVIPNEDTWVDNSDRKL